MTETQQSNYPIPLPKTTMAKVADYQVVPIEQVHFVEKKRIHREFVLYISLKMHGSKFRLNDELFTQACALAGIKDKRTVLKYLKVLTELNWIGYNSKSGVYHVNGTLKIRKQYDFKNRWAVRLYQKDLGHIRAFVLASIVNSKLYKIKSARNYHLGKASSTNTGLAPYLGRGANKGPVDREEVGCTLKERLRSLNYVTLSIEGISKLVPLAKSTISEHKQVMQKLGYLSLKKVIFNVARFDKPNYLAKDQFCKAYPELANRVRFTRNHKMRTYLMGIQMSDEITPLMSFKRLPSVDKKAMEIKGKEKKGNVEVLDLSDEKSVDKYKKMKGRGVF